MREIKLRLIRGTKIVGYEKHVNSCGRIDIFHSVKNEDQPGWEWWNVCVPFTTKPYIECDNKERFTGLHDKNGKEIYEGDIIKYHGAVCFGNIGYDSKHNGLTGFGFSESYQESGFYELNYYDDPDDFEIIGNVHENPELIK